MCNKMENEIKISFIIPAYNAEKTIVNCVESILNIQKYDIEVVVIDDGSKDHTADVCRTINDQRLKIYQKENGGVSQARNIGIEKAEGTYIAFCDADDYVCPSEMEKILDSIEINDDLIMFNIARSSDHQIQAEQMKLKPGKYGKEGLDYLNRLVLDVPLYKKWKNNVQQGSVWRYLYRRHIIMLNDVKFDVGLPYAEDLCFCLKVYKAFENVRVVDNVAYVVNIIEGTASRRFRPDFWNELKQAYEVIVTITEEENPVLYCHYGRAAVNHYLLKAPYKEAKRFILDVLSEDKVIESIRKIDFKSKTMIEKIFDWGCVHKCIFVLLLCKLYQNAFGMIIKAGMHIKRVLYRNKK